MVQVSEEMVRAYRADGAVLIKGLFADWVGPLRDGVAKQHGQSRCIRCKI